MRIASGIFTALFLLSASLQWNDPDPARWIAGYLVAAGLSLAGSFGRVPVVPNAAAALAFAAWFATLAASLPNAPSEAFTSFHMQAASHEEPREAVGLLIAAVWTAALAVTGARRARG